MVYRKFKYRNSASNKKPELKFRLELHCHEYLIQVYMELLATGLQPGTNGCSFTKWLLKKQEDNIMNS